jgi:hypothetical protein
VATGTTSDPLARYRNALSQYRSGGTQQDERYRSIIKKYGGGGSSRSGSGLLSSAPPTEGLNSNERIVGQYADLQSAEQGMEVLGVNVDKPVQFLEWAGDILDTPGSALRATVSNWLTSFEDVLSGEADGYDAQSLVNPLTWIGGGLADTVMGNEMNEQQRQVVDDFWDNTGAGEYLQRTIDEKGWQDTPLNNEFVKGAIGLAGDIGLDPLTYVTLGAGAVGRTGANVALKSVLTKGVQFTDDAGKQAVRIGASQLATDTLDQAPDVASRLARNTLKREASLTSKSLERSVDDIADEALGKLTATELQDRAAEELANELGAAYRRGGNITLRRKAQELLGDDLGNQLFDQLPAPVRGGVRFFGQEITPLSIGNTRLGGGRLLDRMGPLGKLGERAYTGQVAARNRLVSGPLRWPAERIGRLGGAVTDAKGAAARAGARSLESTPDQLNIERTLLGIPEADRFARDWRSNIEKVVGETATSLESAAVRTGDKEAFYSAVGGYLGSIGRGVNVNVDDLNEYDRMAYDWAQRVNTTLQEEAFKPAFKAFGDDAFGEAGIIDDTRRVATDAEADRAAKREGVNSNTRRSEGLKSREGSAIFDEELGETRWMTIDEINAESNRARFTTDPRKILRSVGETLVERVETAARRKAYRDLGITFQLPDELAIAGGKLSRMVGAEADRMARQAERDTKQADRIVSNPNLAGRDAARVADNPDLAEAIRLRDAAQTAAAQAARNADQAGRQADQASASSAAAKAEREARAATDAATSRERAAEARLTRLRAQRDRKVASVAREQIEAARRADQAAEQAKVANREAQTNLRAARRNTAEERARVGDVTADDALTAAEQAEIAATVQADMVAADWSSAQAKRDIARAGDPNVPSAQKVQELDDLIAVTEAEVASARAARQGAADKLAADLDALRSGAADARRTSSRLTAEATDAATAAADMEASILRKQADEILTDVDRLRGVIRAAGTDPEPGGDRYRTLANEFMRMQKSRLDKVTAQLDKDMVTAAKQARAWEKLRTSRVSDDAMKRALVGMRVKANDRGNFGRIVSVDGDTVEVLFVNLAKGTEATRRFNVDDLEPRLLEQARLSASQNRQQAFDRLGVITEPNRSIAEAIAAPDSPFDRLGTTRIRGKRVEVDASIENDFAPTIVAEALTRMHRVRTAPGANNAFMQLFYTPLEALWRTYATVARGPAYVMRNILGGLWNGFLGGIGKADVAAGQAHALAVRRATKKAAEAIKNGEVDLDRLGHIVDDFIAEELRATGIKVGDVGLDVWHDEMVARGLFVDSVSLDLSVGGNMTPDTYVTGMQRNFFPGVDTDTLGRVGQKWAKGVDWAGNNKWVRMMSSFAGASETFLRTSQFYAGIRRYGPEMGPTMGDLLVKSTQFDYGDVSFEERQLIRFGVPFFVWTKNNVPLQIRAMLNQPGKVNAMLRVNAAVQQAFASEEDSWANDVLPEWMREYGGVVSKLTVGGGPLVLGLNNPLTDLNRFLPAPGSLNPADYPGQLLANSGDDVRGMMNPFVKSAIEVTTGTNTFTGREFGETEAPPWYQLLAKLPFVPDTTIDPQTGKVMGSDKFMTQLRNLIPPLGQVERLAPVGPFSNEKYRERWFTSVLSQTAGAALPVTPVGTLTPRQLLGELSRQDRNLSEELQREAAALGLDGKKIQRALKAGMTVQEVQEAIDQGFYRASWAAPTP